MIAEIDPALVLGAEGHSFVSPTGTTTNYVTSAIAPHDVTASDGMTGDEFDEDFDDDFDEDFDDDFEDDFEDDLDDDLDDDLEDDEEFEDGFDDDEEVAIKVDDAD